MTPTSLGTRVATDQAGVRWGELEVLALGTLGVMWPMKVHLWGDVALVPQCQPSRGRSHSPAGTVGATGEAKDEKTWSLL